VNAVVKDRRIPCVLQKKAPRTADKGVVLEHQTVSGELHAAGGGRRNVVAPDGVSTAAQEDPIPVSGEVVVVHQIVGSGDLDAVAATMHDAVVNGIAAAAVDCDPDAATRRSGGVDVADGGVVDGVQGQSRRGDTRGREVEAGHLNAVHVLEEDAVVAAIVGVAADREGGCAVDLQGSDQGSREIVVRHGVLVTVGPHAVVVVAELVGIDRIPRPGDLDPAIAAVHRVVVQGNAVADPELDSDAASRRGGGVDVADGAVGDGGQGEGRVGDPRRRQVDSRDLHAIHGPEPDSVRAVVVRVPTDREGRSVLDAQAMDSGA